MYNNPDQPQQWSVHAEFTITHPGAGNPSNPARTNTVQDDKGVRMLYSWSANDHPNTWSTSSQNNPSESGSYRSSERQYVFQKGNLFFTSTPPAKPSQPSAPVLDSGYGSDLLSPSSFGGSGLPKSGSHPFNRKCRSTCNIILTSNARHQGAGMEAGTSGRAHCGRTQSLRCQTPSACCEKRSENFYGCGDPWCHHLHYADEFSTTRRVSPVREVCEDFQEVSHEDCDRSCVVSESRKVLNLAVKRDVSVQTFEMVNKCTSPLLKVDDSDGQNSSGRKGSRLKRGRTIGRGDSLKKSPIPPSVLTDKIFQKELPKLNRSPSLGKTSPSVREKKGSGSDTKSGDSSKKPRTIHIDVYCTGTDIESDSSCASSSSSSHSKSLSTPQTVFESDKVCITHRKADDKIVPRNFSQTNDTSLEREDSDVDDGESTGYPSKVSSYSTMGQSLTSMSSFPNSATYSLSSCTVPDYESSAANTSWKDTFSDIDSLLQSRNSIGGNDSSYFIPRKIVEENVSGSESLRTGTTNSISLNPSDSFEYDNSEDRLRIKRMERMWKNKHLKQASKNKMLLRQEKLQEAVNKRLSQMNVSKDSESEVSDDSEKGWTFLKGQEEKVTELVVPEAIPPTKESTQPPAPKKPLRVLSKEDSTFLGSLSDSSSPPCKSPSSIIFQQRLSVNPDLRSPFTILPGKYTESRFIAKKFGPIIDVYKKPGHHIGPAKNPDCSCDHCRRYYKDSVTVRNRTSSLGDTPRIPPGQDWGNFVKPDKRYSDF
nr:uncharacterized protein LOC111517830 [Leptinotarsa decemlineata]